MFEWIIKIYHPGLHQLAHDVDGREDDDDFSEGNIVQKFSHGNNFEYFVV